jgi:putative MATE family efflux protein
MGVRVREGLREGWEKNREDVRTAYRIAWPSVLESFFIALAGIIDSLMVSAVGAYGVAAVGLTTQPKFLGMAPFLAITVAVSALVARRKGQEDRDGANQVLLIALLMGIGLIIVLSFGCVIFAEDISRLAGSEADTHSSAVIYFQVIMGGMVFQALSMIINAAQRGCGNTRIAMRTNVTSNVVNMCGNYLIIQGHFGFPAWGIKGAAIATVFGTVIACGMSFRSILREDSFLSLPYIWKKKIRPSFGPLRKMLQMGGSVFLEQVLMRIGFMSVAVMAAKQGTANFAAHQAGMNLLSLTFSFGDGLQAAAVSLIGQSLGQEQPEMAKRYGKICEVMGLGIGVVLAVLYLSCGRFYYELYFVEEEIVAVGVEIMKAIVIITFLQITQIIYMGCLRGAGDILYTTAASTISVTIARPAACYLLCYTAGFGLIGIWAGIGVDQLCRYLFASTRFKRGKWTKIKI